MRSPRAFSHRRSNSLLRRLEAEQEVVAQGVTAAREQLIVGLDELVDGEVAGRVARMREVAPGRDVDGIDAGGVEPLAHLDGLLQRVARLLVAVQRVVVILGADLHLQVEVGAHLGPDGGDDLEEKAGTLTQRAAVVVVAIVDRRAEELREQVAVGRVQFDAVESRRASAPGAGGKRGDGLVDLCVGHGDAREAVQRFIALGGAPSLLELDAGDVALPAAMRELHDEPAVVLVDRVAERPPEGDPRVAVDGGVVGDDAATDRHRDERRDDRADAAARELGLPVDARLVARTVVVVEPARHVRAEDTVLHRQVAERDRLEDLDRLAWVPQ